MTASPLTILTFNDVFPDGSKYSKALGNQLQEPKLLRLALMTTLELREVRDVGPKRLDEIIEQLESFGISLRNANVTIDDYIATNLGDASAAPMMFIIPSQAEGVIDDDLHLETVMGALHELIDDNKVTIKELTLFTPNEVYRSVLAHLVDRDGDVRAKSVANGVKALDNRLHDWGLELADDPIVGRLVKSDSMESRELVDA